MKLIICAFIIIGGVTYGDRCEQNELQCGDGSCILKEYLCDGHRECSDGTDETENVCKHRSCSQVLDFTSGISDFFAISLSQHFRCSYGACISATFVCNGMNNCIDGSDETRELCFEKTCGRNQFKCSYGACLDKQQICNGHFNCKDGSDETAQLCATNNRRCSKYHFRCDYGACIYWKLKCNGKSNCHDNSDEKASICGADHTFEPFLTTRLSDTLPQIKPVPTVKQPEPIPITKSEPIPITQPPRPIETTPAVMQQTTPNPCEPFECRCPAPLDHFCFPCRDVTDLAAICSQVGNDNVCSTEVQDQTEFDIMNCGVNYTTKASDFVRNAPESCGSMAGVPVLTTIYARCWDETSMMLSCQPDGKWHHLGESDAKTSMVNICQPTALNSPVCGKFYNGKREKKYVTRGRKSNYWPFLVGLFIKETFACSGTLISNQWVLTAAHCVVRSQEVPDLTIVSQLITVQHSSSNEKYNLANVSSIFIYPKYTSVKQPKKDIALLKLKRPLVLSSKLFPACVEVKESLLHKTAATFIRNEGEDQFRWQLSTQTVDLDCFNKESRCSRHLAIDDDQFCGQKIDQHNSERLLQGSSGGPYLINNLTDATEQWTVAGVVSHSIDTSGCPFYTVFTSVAYYWPWIKSCVEEDICS